MMYQDEFTRMKQIYDNMPEPKRQLVGPIVGLPIASMALFFLVLLPFGLASLGFVLLAGMLGAAISALMLKTVVDIRPEIAAWRASAPQGDSRPGDAAIRMLSIANDAGKRAAKASKKSAAQG